MSTEWTKEFDAAKQRASDMLDKLDPPLPRSQCDYVVVCMMQLWEQGVDHGQAIEHGSSSW